MQKIMNKGLLTCLALMMTSVFMGCQNPLAGTWFCQAYKDGNVAAVLHEWDFTSGGEVFWTAISGVNKTILLGRYTTDASKTPIYIDMEFVTRVVNGVRSDIPPQNVLGVYRIEDSGGGEKLYLAVRSDGARPLPDTLDITVGPVFRGTREGWAKTLQHLLGSAGKDLLKILSL